MAPKLNILSVSNNIVGRSNYFVFIINNLLAVGLNYISLITFSVSKSGFDNGVLHKKICDGSPPNRLLFYQFLMLHIHFFFFISVWNATKIAQITPGTVFRMNQIRRYIFVFFSEHGAALETRHGAAAAPFASMVCRRGGMMARRAVQATVLIPIAFLLFIPIPTQLHIYRMFPHLHWYVPINLIYSGLENKTKF